MITPGPKTVRKRDRPKSPRYLSEAQIVRETSPKGDGCCRARAGRFDTLASSCVAATATSARHNAAAATAATSGLFISVARRGRAKLDILLAAGGALVLILSTACAWMGELPPVFW